MKHPTLADQLRHYLQERGIWIKKQVLSDDLKWKNQINFTTYSAESVNRALRRLEEQKIIAVKYDHGKALYHYIPPHLRSDYIPTKEREERGITEYRRSKLHTLTR